MTCFCAHLSRPVLRRSASWRAAEEGGSQPFSIILCNEKTITEVIARSACRRPWADSACLAAADPARELRQTYINRPVSTASSARAYINPRMTIWKKISEVPIFGPGYSAGQGETKVAILKGFQQK